MISCILINLTPKTNPKPAPYQTAPAKPYPSILMSTS